MSDPRLLRTVELLYCRADHTCTAKECDVCSLLNHIQALTEENERIRGEVVGWQDLAEKASKQVERYYKQRNKLASEIVFAGTLFRSPNEMECAFCGVHGKESMHGLPHKTPCLYGDFARGYLAPEEKAE